MSATLETLAAVRNERIRQNKKWGVQHHSLPVWLAILAEEFGEASKEINEYHFRDRSAVRIKSMRDELVQTAAVAVAIIEYIDRHSPIQLSIEESDNE